MSTDILMVSKDFKGEAKRHGQDNAIAVLAYSLGAARPPGGSSRPAPTTAFTTINLTTVMDAGVAQLMAMAVRGIEMKQVDIMQFRAGGDDDVMLWSLTLKEVLVDSFSIAGGGDGLPTVNIELSFRTISAQYMPQSVAGLAVDPVMFEFDLSAEL